MRKVTCTMLLVLATAGMARAEMKPATPRAGHWEVALQTRYIGEKSVTGEHGSSIELEDDLGWGFGCAYNATDKVNVGFAFSWRTVDYEARITNPLNDQVISRYSNWLETSMFGVTGEYSILTSRFTPYVAGGVGWAFIDTNIYAGTGSACYWDPWYGYICGDVPVTYGDDAVAWALGAGLRMELAPAVFVRLGYDHGWIDTDRAGDTDMFRVDLGALY